MRSYSVFCGEALDTQVFVKNGFSCSCFLFTFICLLMNKMWDRAIVVALSHVALWCFFKADFIDLSRMYILLITLMLYCGLSFSYWKNEYYLAMEGVEDYIIFSKDLIGAKLKFYRSFYTNTLGI